MKQLERWNRTRGWTKVVLIYSKKWLILDMCTFVTSISASLTKFKFEDGIS